MVVHIIENRKRSGTLIAFHPLEHTKRKVWLMGCVLRVCGKDFAVDHFLSLWPLPINHVWHRGDPCVLPTQPPLEHSGFNLLVSDAEFDDLKCQVQDAIEFLKRFSDACLALGEESGIDEMNLDFGIAFKRNVAAQFTRLPAELVTLAGRHHLSIEISHYWVSEDDEGDSGDTCMCNVES